LARTGPSRSITRRRPSVIWGEHDHAVPLADHAELAMRCGGVLVPIAGAGHAPFLEQPERVVAAIREIAGRAALETAPR
jgi:pimeloyl-ACP methyl ester carboxylesterase